MVASLYVDVPIAMVVLFEGRDGPENVGSVLIGEVLDWDKVVLFFHERRQGSVVLQMGELFRLVIRKLRKHDMRAFSTRAVIAIVRPLESRLRGGR